MDTESRFVKRQSVAKLYGTNATPMMRRCSFPALPLNPEVRTLMMDGFRRPSTDSDEETDCKRRRIRLIRRY
ncbi:hypothetical protein EVAR_91607_1 [Eumeta japonica]|uniref:Uncharacterized protein n=1 Tax=Eumeta variegata TaxID=151549 RepID=A0A4C1UXX7_EUMVA|nr:hypothetical protein EVAR_91607_1 [Eumeta japonica]